MCFYRISFIGTFIHHHHLYNATHRYHYTADNCPHYSTGVMVVVAVGEEWWRHGGRGSVRW